MKVFRHPGYLNRVGMASSDTMRKVLHRLRSDMWIVCSLVLGSPITEYNAPFVCRAFSGIVRVPSF